MNEKRKNQYHGNKLRMFGGVHDLNVEQPFSVACKLSTLAGPDEHWKDAVCSGHGLFAMEDFSDLEDDSMHITSPNQLTLFDSSLDTTDRP